MVRAIATFMDACYIARRNAITAPSLENFRETVEKFHQLRNIFITVGVRASISLPRQHALKHFYRSIHLFGSPNGLCSSITESKHIKSVKEPWRRSNRFKALIQMLRIIVRMEKMAALHQIFSDRGMLAGTTLSYMAGVKADEEESCTSGNTEKEDEDDSDGSPISGDQISALSVVKLASKFGMLNVC